MRILVADEQPKVRFALRVLLERQAGFEIIGETSDAEELLTQTENTCPDVVLLGWELPGFVPQESLTTLRKIRPGLFVIALSGLPEARHAALEAGADVFVSKSDPPERLLAALDESYCC